jgi:hypothetical protein
MHKEGLLIYFVWADFFLLCFRFQDERSLSDGVGTWVGWLSGFLPGKNPVVTEAEGKSSPVVTEPEGASLPTEATLSKGVD